MPDPVNQPAAPRGVLADLSEGEWADLLRDFENAPEAREVAADVHQVLGRVITPPTQPHTTPTPKETRMPTRIQRRRSRGWRKPDNCVIVSRPSRFGNPFTIADAVEAEVGNPRSACAANYAEWLRVGTEGGWYEETYRIGRQVFDRRRVLADLHLLRGKDLACTCPLPEPGEPDHCHAAVLLRLAAGESL